MNVSAIIVTRGDVPLGPILESLPPAWEKIVWNNAGWCSRWLPVGHYEKLANVEDEGVYGRYAAIDYATSDVIYVQDDDVIVSDPRAIVRCWEAARAEPFLPLPYGSVSRAAQGAPFDRTDHIVCNMPQEFRHDFYRDHALVGFGAAFHRDAPDMAFSLMVGAEDTEPPFFTEGWGEIFNRTCDVVFTGLTPRVLVDVPKENMPYASDDNRMWKQPQHQGERARMLDLVLRAREDSL